MESYHIGLRKAGKTVIVELADTVDQLSCELWQYYGEHVNTVAELEQNKAAILKVINVEYGTDFQEIKIQRIASGDFTAGHQPVLG